MRDLQGTYVFWSESYSWSYQWLQPLSRHHLAKLLNLSLPVPGAHFLNIGVPRNRRYNYCVLIGIVMLFQLGEALVLISSFSLLQKMIELPTISHFMEGFLQLHTLGCCVPIILMVVTILVPILEVGRSFDGLGSSEHWATLNFHKDIARACVETPTSLLISLWALVWLSITIFP